MANMCGYMDLSRFENKEKYIVIASRCENAARFNFLDFIKPKYNPETEESSGLEEEID